MSVQWLDSIDILRKGYDTFPGKFAIVQVLQDIKYQYIVNYQDNGQCKSNNIIIIHLLT